MSCFNKNELYPIFFPFLHLHLKQSPSSFCMYSNVDNHSKVSFLFPFMNCFLLKETLSLSLLSNVAKGLLMMDSGWVFVNKIKKTNRLSLLFSMKCNVITFVRISQ